jgi:hypothetical protein
MFCLLQNQVLFFDFIELFTFTGEFLYICTEHGGTVRKNGRAGVRRRIF